ncbi:hypothetical protein VB735_23675 [Halotia wernerae UHCC 0503]|nr:hypothetical protein [Halotia wernerae UHCC 0503]
MLNTFLIGFQSRNCLSVSLLLLGSLQQDCFYPVKSVLTAIAVLVCED